MSDPIADLRRHKTELAGAIKALGAKNDLTRSESERWNELTTEYDAVAERESELTERSARAAKASMAYESFGVNRGGRPTGVRSEAIAAVERSAGLVPDAAIENGVREIEADPTSKIAEHARVTGSPSYLRAFTKMLRDPERGHLEWTPEERQAWSEVRDYERGIGEGSVGVGSGMVPYVLDPAIQITGAGAINPFRQICSVKKTVSNNYHAVSAAQVSASVLAENAVFADATPTFTAPTINVYKNGAYLPASFEAFEDMTDLASEVVKLFADAKATLENTQFATGTGSAQPNGLVTATTAVAGSRVPPTTGGAFALPDLYLVQNALPSRYSANASWMANLKFLNLTRRFGEGTTGSNSAFWADLGGTVPAQLLGRDIYEASAMSSTVAVGQNVLLYGDFSRYYIVDRIGAQVEFIPNVFDQATGRPSGTRAWLMHWRVGADMVDGADSMRVLKL